jgi:hypothetical protein
MDKQVKHKTEQKYITVAGWIRQLAAETATFDVEKVIESEMIGTNKKRMEWDYVVTLSTKIDHRQIEIFVITRSQVTPKTVLAIFQNIKWLPPNGQMMICAPCISTRVAEMCKEQNVAYLDAVGNCRIIAPGLIIHISGHPPRKAPIQTINDPFSRKSSRIVRALLTQPDKGWQVQQLAKEADVSLGLVSKVKKVLIDEAYLEERDQLLYLRDPVKLLQNWSTQYRPQVNPVQLFTLFRPLEAETHLAEWCRENKITYAFTQLSGAWRYSPMVRYDKSVVYMDRKVVSEDKFKALLDYLSAKEVDTGVNCTVWLTDDSAVFSDSREVDGVRIVSPIQLYLDLKNLPGRGEEAAQEVLQKELRTLLSPTSPTRDPSLGGQK